MVIGSLKARNDCPMENPSDHLVREFGSTLLALRDDLIFTPQGSGTETHYVVEDPLNSRFFRLGPAEYTFLSLLDGRTTVWKALGQLATRLPNSNLGENDAVGLCHWLVAMDLAHTVESSQASRLASNANDAARAQAVARCNPLVFRLPLCHPDRVFTALEGWTTWLFSPAAFVPWLAIVLVGAYQVTSEWSRFATSTQTILAPGNWLWLAVCWILLKIVHETSHGIVAKRYGGTVRETGVLFVLFAPLAYVDVTSSWRFPSARQRIHVAAAGMYTELMIASLAAIVWCNSLDGGWLSVLCQNVIVMASVATLVFNANPLMKFDGYYILSDVLAIPNLYANGQRYLRYFARKYLLGVPAALAISSRREETITWTYGIASFLWRIALCATLVIGTVTMFHGAGIVLTICAMLLWVGLPAFRFIQYIAYGKPGEQPRRIRFLAFTLGFTAAAILVLGFVPWPGASIAPAIVEFAPLTIIRAASAGFVDEIYVVDGERVQKDQLLLVIENDEFASELTELGLQIKQSEIRGRQHEQNRRYAAFQAEIEQRRALHTELEEKRAQFKRLEVRAPAAGTVIARDLKSLHGTYVKVGDEVAAIGDEHNKEIRISVPQDQFESFTLRCGHGVRVDLPGIATWNADLERVTPRASKQPIHPALSAINGGPLPIKGLHVGSSHTQEQRYELLEPQFSGIVRLDDSASRTVFAGQRGTVFYRPWRESIGEHLWYTIARWIQRQLTGQEDRAASM